MKRFFFCLIAASFLFSKASAQEITVLTYNILHGERDDRPNTSNVAEVAKLLLQLQPEVIALQEVDSMTRRSARFNPQPLDYVSKLSQETGYRGYFAKAMDYDGGGYGEGILVKKGSDYHTLQLPNPVGGEPRAMAWVMAELKSQEEFYFGATHLCHEFGENRIAQVDAILAYADSLDKPVVWVGDLNFRPDSPEYSRIPAHWKEAGAASGQLQNTYGTAEKGARIDYIWYDSRKLELVEYKVLDQVKFSDHYPVWAILRLKKEPQHE
ncbi:endonuclease/exonuclease/phosphatase family protein [Algoriphagus sp. H41]|uniref:Endonuclease/exonuclease/phosphatase family protein n=1 Tax=Algoriphagus oliviformis TaxID=2811231 RepID=A0ABS3C4V3_9BACT|nr:endonuclease/exonuclease/phosphatase family protein [Algoriphagus oliviformis]MBN7812152.1 endonuclease/exonuclease/phosphatase family protein [Algoriphagus oliviformis]